jgi:YVTN family beta-propeller protein
MMNRIASAIALLLVVVAIGCAGVPAARTTGRDASATPVETASVSPAPVDPSSPQGSAAAPSAAALPSARSVAPSASVALENVSHFVAADAELWVGVEGSGTVHRIDLTSATIVETATVPQSIGVVHIASGAAWVTDFEDNRLYQFNMRSGKRVATIETGQGPDSLLAAYGSLWVANHFGGSVSRVDPSSGRVTATITTGEPGRGGPASMLDADGKIWVAVPLPGSVAAIDPETDQVTDEVDVATNPCGVAWTGMRILASSCLNVDYAVEAFAPGDSEAAAVDPRAFLGDSFAVEGRAWMPVTELRGARTGDEILSEGRLPQSIVAFDPVTLEMSEDAVTLGEPIMGVRDAPDSVWVILRDRVVRLPFERFAR